MVNIESPQCTAVMRAGCLKREGFKLEESFSCMNDVPATEETYARFRERLGQEFFMSRRAVLVEDPTSNTETPAQ